MLAHNVYFTLKDKTPAARAKLVEACRHFLTGHPGCLFFACGTREERLQRPVNDRDFDVALHLVFDSKESHDTYQDSARHVEFVEQNRAGWEKARVFDSTVEGAS
jgi:hypothetical protein